MTLFGKSGSMGEMRRRIWFLVLGVLLPATVVTSQEPRGQREGGRTQRTPETVEIRSDLVYARYGERTLRLDLVLPREKKGPLPAVVYIHGGGWRGGNRSAFRRQAIQMATKGFLGALIEYRFSNEAPFPAAVHDCKAAVRWLRANASTHGIDPQRIGAAGGSAGGHLAAFLGTTGHLPRFEGKGGNAGHSSRVRAVAAFNPVLDFEDLAWREGAAEKKDRALHPFLGTTYFQNPQRWIEASPITHVGEESAAFLLLHGTTDPVVPYRQSVQMRDGLRAQGIEVELFTAEGMGHGFFNRPPWYEKTLQAMEAFFASHLK